MATDTRTPPPPAPTGLREGEAPVIRLSPDAAAVADDLFGGVETVVVDACRARQEVAQGKLLEAKEVADRIEALLESIRTPKRDEGPDAINHYVGVVLDLRVELGEPRELPATLNAEVTDALGLQTRYADAVATLARNKDVLGDGAFVTQSAKIEGGYREKIAPKVEAAIRELKRYAEEDLLPRRREQQETVVTEAARRAAELEDEETSSFARTEIVQAPETVETAKRRLQRVVECAVGVSQDMQVGKRQLALVREQEQSGRATRDDVKKHWTDKMSLARLVTEVATDHIFEALREKHGEDGAIRMCNVEPIVREEDAKEMDPGINPYITCARHQKDGVGVTLMHPDMDTVDALTFAREVQQARFLFSLLVPSLSSEYKKKNITHSMTELAGYARLAAFNPEKVESKEVDIPSPDRIRLDGDSADCHIEIPEKADRGYEEYDIYCVLQKLANSKGGFNGKDQPFILMRVLGDDINVLNRNSRNQLFQDVGMNVDATGGLLTVGGQSAAPEHVQEFDGRRNRYSELKRQIGGGGLTKPRDIASLGEAREFVEDLVAQAAQREIDLKKGHEERERELREQQQKEVEHLKEQLRKAREEAAREKTRADKESGSVEDLKKQLKKANSRVDETQAELERVRNGNLARDKAFAALRWAYGRGGFGSGKHVKEFLGQGPDGDKKGYEAAIRAAEKKERGA